MAGTETAVIVKCTEDGKIAISIGRVGEDAGGIKDVTDTTTVIGITANIAELRSAIGVLRGIGDTDI
jgi:hypothetical protein